MTTSNTTALEPDGASDGADHAEEAPADQLDRVTEDPRLTPAEKETTWWFDKTTDTARLFTAEAGLMRRALQHPHAEVLETVERDGEIHGVRVALPVGCVSVSLDPRTTGGHAEVITRRVLTADGQGGSP